MKKLMVLAETFSDFQHYLNQIILHKPPHERTYIRHSDGIEVNGALYKYIASTRTIKGIRDVDYVVTGRACKRNDYFELKDELKFRNCKQVYK